MFVGETGLSRVVKRTLEVMKELGSDDPARIRAHGAVDLPLVQKYLNFCARPLWICSVRRFPRTRGHFASA